MQQKKTLLARMNPAQVLAIGFAAIILLGAVMLRLPIATTVEGGISFFDALFTATSCTCVTGLAVLDTAKDFTAFGHVVMLLLIQVGGLGFMLFATLLMLFFRRRISLHSRMLMRDTVGQEGLRDVVGAMLRVGVITLLVEGVGCLLLSVVFVPEYGWGKGLWYALFHSVSAFCNAGFDLFGNYESLLKYQENYYLQIVICLLIVLGGIGYAVMADVWSKRHRQHRLSLHTKLVLVTTCVLLLGGFVLFLLLEWHGDLPLGQKLMNAFFQSVTVRTAGFSAIDQAKLTDGSKLLSVILMFIGASPASTGGGAKTTTVCLLLLVAHATVRGRREINVFGRSLAVMLVRTAICILLVNMSLLLGGTLILSVTEAGKGFSLIDLMYETVSALSTVGLTAAGTPKFSRAGRLMLILYMYFGRVGPMTIMLVLSGRQKDQAMVRYPEEHLLIG